MTNKSMAVAKGSSSKVFVITLKGITDYTDYYLDLDVLDPTTLVSEGIPKVVAPEVDNSGFRVSLTPAETASLALGEYLVAAEITCDPIGNGILADFTYRKELSWQLEITKSLLNN